MKKFGKKIKAGLLVCVMVTVALGGVKIFGEVSGTVSAPQNSSQIAEIDIQTATALSSTAETGESSDLEASSQDLLMYLKWVNTYNPTEEAKQIIGKLIASGADANALIDVCIFWEDTDEPFSIVEEIYSLAPEDLSEYTDHIIWIESTYNHLTGKENEALTIDEVKAYVESGISTHDILIANRMSRKDGNDINEILNRYKDGKTWYELIISEDEPSVAEFENIGGNNLLDIKIISENTGQSIDSLLTRATKMEDGELIYTISAEKTAKAKAELAQMGLMPESATE